MEINVLLYFYVTQLTPWPFLSTKLKVLRASPAVPLKFLPYISKRGTPLKRFSAKNCRIVIDMRGDHVFIGLKLAVGKLAVEN